MTIVPSEPVNRRVTFTLKTHSHSVFDCGCHSEVLRRNYRPKLQTK